MSGNGMDKWKTDVEVWLDEGILEFREPSGEGESGLLEFIGVFDLLRSESVCVRVKNFSVRHVIGRAADCV
jgi:hypothetical protein